MEDTTLVAETAYCRVVTNPHRQSLDITWFESTEAMTDEEFRRHLVMFADAAEEHHPRFLFVYAQQMRHAISSSTQEWHDEYIVPRYAKAGVERMAFMLPDSFLARLSHEETFDEEQAQELIETNFFTDEAEADHWLLN
jgi:hypothetical protein